jgi:hypothetical protein
MPTWLLEIVPAIGTFASICGLIHESWSFRKDLRYDAAVTNIKGFGINFPGLKMTFDDTPVRDVSIINLLIRNTGSKAIEGKDYECPLEIKVSCREILGVGEPEVNRQGIKPQVNMGHDVYGFEISPLLLNSGDEIRFPILAEEFKKIAVVGRISGVKEIKRIDPNRNAKFSYWSGILLGCGMYLIPSVYAQVIHHGIPAHPFVAIPLMIAFLGLLLGGVYLLFFEYLAKARWDRHRKN